MRSKEEIYKALKKLINEFDECGCGDTYDMVYYQLEGILEDWDDIDEDLLKSLNELTDSLEAYIKWINNEPELNWIYR